MKKLKIPGIFLLLIILYIYLSPGNLAVPVEQLDIPSGLGFDIINTGSDGPVYQVSMSNYTFNKKDEISSIIIDGKSFNIPDTREVRQLESNHKFIYGLEKVLLISEEAGRFGISNTINIMFSNQDINDMGWVVVSRQTANDTLRFKVDEYPTSADFIADMIDNFREYYFFSNNYKIMDMYVRVDSEGRNIVLPYIEIVKNELHITGMAAFIKDKMVRRLDMEDSKIMNFMRENGTRGIFSLQKDIRHYISQNGSVKRKVKCEKKDGRFKFILDLSYSGDIISNSMYENMQKDTAVIRRYEADMSEYITQRCRSFIQKMQNEYRLDLLELGRIAAAKYGRKTGVDWNEVVSNSDIEVNVKVKVNKMGRGNYEE